MYLFIKKFFVSIIIICFVCVLFCLFYFRKYSIEIINKSIENLFYFNLEMPFMDEKFQIENSERVLLTLEIPSINLKENVYTIDSELNHVDLNVQILEYSSSDNQLIFLAAHSGGGSNSYFNSLVYLENSDTIFIYYQDKCFVFVVRDKFYIFKDGYFEIEANYLEKSLFLITCSLDYMDRQLIVRAELLDY